MRFHAWTRCVSQASNNYIFIGHLLPENGKHFNQIASWREGVIVRELAHRKCLRTCGPALIYVHYEGLGTTYGCRAEENEEEWSELVMDIELLLELFVEQTISSIICLENVL